MTIPRDRGASELLCPSESETALAPDCGSADHCARTRSSPFAGRFSAEWGNGTQPFWTECRPSNVNRLPGSLPRSEWQFDHNWLGNTIPELGSLVLVLVPESAFCQAHEKSRNRGKIWRLSVKKRIAKCRFFPTETSQRLSSMFSNRAQKYTVGVPRWDSSISTRTLKLKEIK